MERVEGQEKRVIEFDAQSILERGFVDGDRQDIRVFDFVIVLPLLKQVTWGVSVIYMTVIKCLIRKFQYGHSTSEQMIVLVFQKNNHTLNPHTIAHNSAVLCFTFKMSFVVVSEVGTQYQGFLQITTPVRWVQKLICFVYIWLISMVESSQGWAGNEVHCFSSWIYTYPAEKAHKVYKLSAAL